MVWWHIRWVTFFLNQRKKSCRFHRNTITPCERDQESPQQTNPNSNPTYIRIAHGFQLPRTALPLPRIKRSSCVRRTHYLSQALKLGLFQPKTLLVPVCVAFVFLHTFFTPRFTPREASQPHERSGLLHTCIHRKQHLKLLSKHPSTGRGGYYASSVRGATYRPRKVSLPPQNQPIPPLPPQNQPKTPLHLPIRSTSPLLKIPLPKTPLLPKIPLLKNQRGRKCRKGGMGVRFEM